MSTTASIPDSAASPPQSMNLFVANLSNDVTDEMLEARFRPFGKILTCKVMLDIHTGVSRGFGFVLFEQPEDGANAMATLHSTQLGSKQIYISVAQTNGRSGMQQTPKLYVRNVPKTLTLDTLREHFSKYGEIVRINFRDDNTQANAPPEHRAYLATTTVIFLEYKTAAEAEEAVRASHATKPWPNMEIPLLSKPAETSQMRNERRQRQTSKSASQSMRSNTSSGLGASSSMGSSQPGAPLPTAAPVMPTFHQLAPQLAQPVTAPYILFQVPQQFQPNATGGVPQMAMPMMQPGAAPMMMQQPPWFSYNAPAPGAPIYFIPQNDQLAQHSGAPVYVLPQNP